MEKLFVGEEAIVAMIGPWEPLLFLGLASAVLWAVDRWMAVLGLWSDEGVKGVRRPLGILLAVLSTLVVVGAWYALDFVALPSGA